MSGFRPSPEAAAEALIGVPLERGVISTGLKGAKFSLEEVAKRVKEGSRDPRVIGWAGRVLVEAGKPRTPHEQAQALLDALRKKTIYTPDPVGAERITAAKYTLCLDELGLCMPAADCDDLSVALGSALMAIGIPVQLVAQSFDNSGAPSHVLVAAETSPGKWERIDPSSSRYAVGEFYTATQEWWFDPMEKIDMDDAGKPLGDYIGVGAPPSDIGLGQYENVVLQIPEAAKLTTEQKAAIYGAATGQLEAAVNALDKAVTGLEVALQQITQTRAVLRTGNPFDPEPNPPITSVGAFPKGGVWTKNMNEIAWWLVAVGKKFVHAGREALGGGRKIFVDQRTQDVYVEGNNTDTFRLNTIKKTADVVLAFLNPAGSIIAGLTASDGQVLSKEQTERELLAARGASVQGLGAAPVIIVVAVVLGIVVLSVTAIYVIKEWCHTAEVTAREAVHLEIMRCVADGKCTPEQARATLDSLNRNRIAVAEAEAKAKAATDPMANLAKAMMYMAIGGGVIAGSYFAYPLVKTAAEKWAAARSHRQPV